MEYSCICIFQRQYTKTRDRKKNIEAKCYFLFKCAVAAFWCFCTQNICYLSKRNEVATLFLEHFYQQVVLPIMPWSTVYLAMLMCLSCLVLGKLLPTYNTVQLQYSFNYLKIIFRIILFLSQKAEIKCLIMTSNWEHSFLKDVSVEGDIEKTMWFIMHITKITTDKISAKFYW